MSSPDPALVELKKVDSADDSQMESFHLQVYSSVNLGDSFSKTFNERLGEIARGHCIGDLGNRFAGLGSYKEWVAVYLTYYFLQYLKPSEQLTFHDLISWILGEANMAGIISEVTAPLYIMTAPLDLMIAPEMERVNGKLTPIYKQLRTFYNTNTQRMEFNFESTYDVVDPSVTSLRTKMFSMPIAIHSYLAPQKIAGQSLTVTNLTISLPGSVLPIHELAQAKEDLKNVFACNVDELSVKQLQDELLEDDEAGGKSELIKKILPDKKLQALKDSIRVMVLKPSAVVRARLITEGDSIADLKNQQEQKHSEAAPRMRRSPSVAQTLTKEQVKELRKLQEQKLAEQNRAVETETIIKKQVITLFRSYQDYNTLNHGKKDKLPLELPTELMQSVGEWYKAQGSASFNALLESIPESELKDSALLESTVASASVDETLVSPRLMVSNSASIAEQKEPEVQHTPSPPPTTTFERFRSILIKKIDEDQGQEEKRDLTKLNLYKDQLKRVIQSTIVEGTAFDLDLIGKFFLLKLELGEKRFNHALKLLMQSIPDDYFDTAYRDSFVKQQEVKKDLNVEAAVNQIREETVHYAKSRGLYAEWVKQQIDQLSAQIDKTVTLESVFKQLILALRAKPSVPETVNKFAMIFLQKFAYEYGTPSSEYAVKGQFVQIAYNKLLELVCTLTINGEHLTRQDLSHLQSLPQILMTHGNVQEDSILDQHIQMLFVEPIKMLSDCLLKAEKRQSDCFEEMIRKYNSKVAKLEETLQDYINKYNEVQKLYSAYRSSHKLETLANLIEQYEELILLLEDVFKESNFHLSPDWHAINNLDMAQAAIIKEQCAGIERLKSILAQNRELDPKKRKEAYKDVVTGLQRKADPKTISVVQKFLSRRDQVATEYSDDYTQILNSLFPKMRLSDEQRELIEKQLKAKYPTVQLTDDQKQELAENTTLAIDRFTPDYLAPFCSHLTLADYELWFSNFDGLRGESKALDDLHEKFKEYLQLRFTWDPKQRYEKARALYQLVNYCINDDRWINGANVAGRRTNKVLPRLQENLRLELNFLAYVLPSKPRDKSIPTTVKTPDNDKVFSKVPKAVGWLWKGFRAVYRFVAFFTGIGTIFQGRRIYKYRKNMDAEQDAQYQLNEKATRDRNIKKSDLKEEKVAVSLGVSPSLDLSRTEYPTTQTMARMWTEVKDSADSVIKRAVIFRILRALVEHYEKGAAAEPFLANEFMQQHPEFLNVVIKEPFFRRQFLLMSDPMRYQALESEMIPAHAPASGEEKTAPLIDMVPGRARYLDFVADAVKTEQAELERLHRLADRVLDTGKRKLVTEEEDRDAIRQSEHFQALITQINATREWMQKVPSNSELYAQMKTLISSFIHECNTLEQQAKSDVEDVDVSQESHVIDSAFAMLRVLPRWKPVIEDKLADIRHSKAQVVATKAVVEQLVPTTAAHPTASPLPIPTASMVERAGTHATGSNPTTPRDEADVPAVAPGTPPANDRPPIPANPTVAAGEHTPPEEAAPQVRNRVGVTAGGGGGN